MSAPAVGYCRELVLSQGVRGAEFCGNRLPCSDHSAPHPYVSGHSGISGCVSCGQPEKAAAHGAAIDATRPEAPARHISRPGRDEVWLTVAGVVSKLSTCYRRRVGCVLLDARGHVLATGYNGVASKMPHCNDPGRGSSTLFPHRCPGASSPSGTNLDACLAIHAEQNALVQCGAPWEIDACYVTASPCVSCTKLLLNTSCRKIIFLERYPQAEAEKLWTFAGQGRVWQQGSSLLAL